MNILFPDDVHIEVPRVEGYVPCMPWHVLRMVERTLRRAAVRARGAAVEVRGDLERWGKEVVGGVVSGSR